MRSHVKVCNSLVAIVVFLIKTRAIFRPQYAWVFIAVTWIGSFCLRWFFRATGNNCLRILDHLRSPTRKLFFIKAIGAHFLHLTAPMTIRSQDPGQSALYIQDTFGYFILTYIGTRAAYVALFLHFPLYNTHCFPQRWHVKFSETKWNRL